MEIREQSYGFTASEQRTHRPARSAAAAIVPGNTGSSLAACVAPAGEGNPMSSENAPAAGQARPEHEQTAPLADDGRITMRSSPSLRQKTLQDRVREIDRLVDGAMRELEQVRRALRWLEKDL